MRNEFGRERLRGGTVQTLQEGSATRDLSPIMREMEILGEEEHRDWERQQTANARAETYRIGEEIQQSIQEGKAVDAEGRPWNEKQLLDEFRNRINKQVGTMHPQARRAAQADVTQTSSVIEAGLRGALREYQGNQRLVELGVTTDKHAQTAIDARLDVVTALTLDQAINDINASIELSPLQKQDRVTKLKKAVWGTRLNRRLEDPSIDLEATREWVDGLSIDVGTREEFRNLLDKEGKEIKRAEADSFLDQQKNAYIEADETGRRQILTGVDQYLTGRKGLWEPEKFGELKRKWEDDARKQAFLSDLSKRGAGGVSVSSYGFDPDQETWAAETVENRKYTEMQQEAYLRNRAEAEQAKIWNQAWGNERIELIQAMRDPEFDPTAIDDLQAKIQIRQQGGWTYGDEAYASLENLKRDFYTKRDLRLQADALYGTGGMDQKLADVKWGDEYQQRINDQSTEKDINQFIVDFSVNAGRLPSHLVDRLNAVAMNPNAKKNDAENIRRSAALYNQVKKSAPAATSYLKPEARAVYDYINHVPNLSDEAIGTAIKQALDPNAQTLQRAVWADRDGMKETERLIERAISGGPAAIRTEFSLAENLVPDLGMEIDNAEAADLVKQDILNRAGEYFAMTSNPSRRNAIRNAAADVFQTWGIWYNGENAQWMRYAPTKYIPDTKWLAEMTEAFLNAHGYSLAPGDITSNPMAAASFAMAGQLPPSPGERRTQTFIELEIVDGTEKNALPDYYVFVDGDLLTDKDGEPYTFGGTGEGSLLEDWTKHLKGLKKVQKKFFEEKAERERRADEAYVDGGVFMH